MNNDYKFDGFTEYEQVELEKIKLGVSTRIHESAMLHNPQISFDRIADYIVANVRGYVLGEHQEVVLEKVKYPKDWRQSLKDRWFPDWLLHKYPVEYTEVKIKANTTVLYPKLKISIPNEWHTIIFEVKKEK